MEKLVYNSSEQNPREVLRNVKVPKEYQIALWTGGLDDLDEDGLNEWFDAFDDKD